MKAVMYHYVRPDDPAYPHFRHLPLPQFEQQLDYFESEYRLISREEFVRAVEGGEPVPNGVVLTFDDGLKDHFDYVFAVLRRRGLFGIFYISAYPYLSGKILDVHRTHLLLGRFGGQTIWNALSQLIAPEMLSHADVGEFRKQTYRLQTNDEFTNQVKRTLNYYIDYRHRTKIMEALMGEFFPEEESLAATFYLSPEEMKQMTDGGMILGSHTVTHPCMSKLSVEEQKREIVDSFNLLESFLGRTEPRTFCYPYGGFHSFTTDTQKLLEEAGCLFSFNVEHRDITGQDLRSARQALPRYDCNLFPPVKKS